MIYNFALWPSLQSALQSPTMVRQAVKSCKLSAMNGPVEYLPGNEHSMVQRATCQIIRSAAPVKESEEEACQGKESLPKVGGTQIKASAMVVRTGYVYSK